MNISESSKFKISPTASLVLSLASEVYQDGKTSQSYFENIDLSEGTILLQNLKHIYKYTKSLVILRKNYIRQLFDQYAYLFQKFQVCILGAGLDPLSLHLLEQYDKKISSIFEVDMAFMDEKRAMYSKLIGNNNKLNLITHDATEIDSLMGKLKKLGYHSSQPTIFLLEGFVPYISRDKFSTLMEKLKTNNKRNLLIFDYVLPFESVHESYRDECRNMIRSVEQITGWPMQVYHRSDITELIQFFEGEIKTADSSKSIEKQISGENKIFSHEGNGFIEMISCQL